MKVPYFKLSKTMLMWKPMYYTNGAFDDYWCYICWWNVFPKGVWNWGYEALDYDAQPHRSFSFGKFNVTWCFG